MTNHIKERIERILFNGGIVIEQLKVLIDILEDIRGVDSINREFTEAFEDIEKRKGSITPNTKQEAFLHINKIGA